MTDQTDQKTDDLREQTDPRVGNATTIVLVLGVVFFIALFYGRLSNSANAGALGKRAITSLYLVGRQGTLVERMANDVLSLHTASLKHKAPTHNELDELVASAILFEETNKALTEGGKVEKSADEFITVDKLVEPAQQRLLAEIAGEWAPLYAQIMTLKQRPNVPWILEDVTQASSDARPVLGQSINALLNAENQSYSNKYRSLSTDRDLMEWLALLDFLSVGIAFYVRVSGSKKQLASNAEYLVTRNKEIESTARQLAEAKASSDLIMDTINEGLFLIDTKYKIQGEYSHALEKIFRTPELSGYNFLNILQRLLTERMFNTSRDYLGLLFDKARKERTVIKVNPLDEVEVNFANPEGGFISKFLHFSFHRIVENGEITRLFIAVNDITSHVQLERELRESERRKERQFEFLLEILHVEPKQLDDFLNTAKDEISKMNDTLRAEDFAISGSGKMDLLRQRLDTVYRSVHNIKGNASMLKLHYFQRLCDQFEAKIIELKNRTALGGDDFLSVVIAQSELRQDFDDLQELREKFVGLNRFSVASAGAQASAGDDLMESLASLANQVGRKQEKEAVIDSTGFDTRSLPDDRRRIVKDVLIQFVRNSMTHGIEETKLRKALGKPRAGTLTIHRIPDTSEEIFGFIYRDDGRGLDPARIRLSAVSKGLITAEQAAAMHENEIVGLIFHPGFSTADETTTDAGRGIGMNVIKEAVIDKCGGEISVNSEPGQFTEFTIMIPLSSTSAAPLSVPQFAHN